MIILNEKPLKFEKTTSSVLYVLLLIYVRDNGSYAGTFHFKSVLQNQFLLFSIRGFFKSSDVFEFMCFGNLFSQSS